MNTYFTYSLTGILLTICNVCYGRKIDIIVFKTGSHKTSESVLSVCI